MSFYVFRMRNIRIHIVYYLFVMALCVCDIYTGRIFSIRALLFLPLYFYIMHANTTKNQAIIFAIFVAMIWTTIDLGIEDVSPSFFLFLSLAIRLAAFGGLSIILLRVKQKQMQHASVVADFEVQRQQLQSHIAKSISSFRPSLSNIQSFAQLALDANGDQLTVQQQNYIRNIRITASQLYSELNELEDFAKVGAQKMQLFVLQYDYLTTLREIIQQGQVLINKKSLQIHLDCAETRLSANFDRHRMGQALLSVLLHAIEISKYNTTIHIEVERNKSILQTKIFGTSESLFTDEMAFFSSLEAVNTILEAHNGFISVGPVANSNHRFEYYISFPI